MKPASSIAVSAFIGILLVLTIFAEPQDEILRIQKTEFNIGERVEITVNLENYENTLLKIIDQERTYQIIPREKGYFIHI